MGLLTPEQKEEARRLKTSAEGKALQVPCVGPPDTQALTLLAAGFGHGQPGAPVIPYVRLS